ncbi:unnamed protein product, partial [Symbiodinium sp. KB8]
NTGRRKGKAVAMEETQAQNDAAEVVEMQPPIHADEAAEAFEEECPTDDDTLPEAFCAAEQLHCIAQFVMLPKNAEEKVLDLSCHACGRLLCRQLCAIMLSIGAHGARPTNSVTDFLLCVELTTCLVIWLRSRSRVVKKHALFNSYALNLLGGAAWTASGVYVHLFEPLPQEPTIAWQIFLNMGATTPFLFPLDELLVNLGQPAALPPIAPPGPEASDSDEGEMLDMDDVLPADELKKQGAAKTAALGIDRNRDFRARRRIAHGDDEMQQQGVSLGHLDSKRLFGSGVSGLEVSFTMVWQAALEGLSSKDYYPFFRKEVDTTWQVYQEHSFSGLLEHCQCAWICIPRNRLNKFVHRYLRVVDMDMDDRRLHMQMLKRVSDKVQAGEIFELDVELGAWIAAGKLKEHRVVVLQGLATVNELKDYPFWRHVRTKPLKVVQMCPFGMLMYKQKADVAWPVLGCSDARHVLKRYTCHHFGGLRSIQHGSVASDNGQSRPSHLSRHPERRDVGQGQLHAPQSGLLPWLLVCSWMQAVPPPWRHPLQRAVLAYHLFQLHASEGVPHYASQSTAHCFPHETIKICMYLAVHAMMHCLAHSGDGELPWLLKYRQEFIAKSHFEKIKQAFRGQPSVRDGLYGTLLLHWNQCRGKDRFSNSWTPEPWLTEAEATSIAAESLKDALFLQSRNSRQRSEQQIKQQLKDWWAADGAKMVTGYDVKADTEDDGDVGDVHQEAEAEQAAKLMACADHIKVQHQLALGRNASNLGAGSRTSRGAGWYAVQRQECPALEDPEDQPKVVGPLCTPTTYGCYPKPGEKAGVVVQAAGRQHRHGLGFECLPKCRAQAKGRAKIRLMELAPRSKRTWTGTPMNNVHLVDPTGVVVAEIKYVQVLEENGCLHIRFSEDVLGLLKFKTLPLQPYTQPYPGQALTPKAKRLEEKPWTKEGPPPAEARAKVPESFAGFTFKHFAGTSSSKNVIAFLGKLPGMFEERGVKLLDDNGLFQMGGKKVPWVELVARSPALFEQTILSSGNAYGKAVCGKLLTLHPVTPNGKSNVQRWMQHVDVVVRDAFYRDTISSSAARLQDISAAVCALLYALLTWGSFDLAGRKLPPIAVSPWHAIDGRSYAGAAFGVKFDLLSSMPSARSDSQFVLSVLFMASNALSSLLLLNVCYNRAKDLTTAQQRVARVLAVFVFAMLANCHLLAVLVAGGYGPALPLDIFHVLQGLIIGICFTQLREVLVEDKAKDA